MAKSNSTTLLILGGIGAAAYYYWAQIQAEAATFGITLPGGAGGSTVPAGATVTNNSPTIGTPGAVPLGTQGCFSYAGMVSCPPGVSPPAPAPPQNNCAPGYSIDANGVCTLYNDAQLLAGLNSIQWTGSTAVPTEQITRVDPQILAQYGSTTGVNPGTVLAYMLGLGAGSSNGTTETGSDGNLYTMTNGVYIRRSSTLQGIRGVRLGAISQALPVTNSILVEASHNPDTAAIVGNDPRALLTVPQWNYFYAQASGVLQAQPQHPAGDPGARVNAATYHQIRQDAGLPVRLGTLRPSRAGMFPLGAIRPGPARVPYTFPGNRTIYRVPGRGSVVAAAGSTKRGVALGVITPGGGNHRWARSPFPRPADWRRSEDGQ